MHLKMEYYDALKGLFEMEVGLPIIKNVEESD